MSQAERFDAIVVGGGPAGATAATELARRGFSVLLLDREGRIKPCGGAIPPKLLEEFAVPEAQLAGRARSARMIAPSGKQVDMPIEANFVGMVDREVFDAWLRERAARAGAGRAVGCCEGVTRAGGEVTVHYRPPGASGCVQARARAIIGADGANSRVARDFADEPHPPFVFAYHEIVRAPASAAGGFDRARCEVHYRGALSPDFYGWVFPHGETASVGVGSAMKGFSLRGAVASLRAASGLQASDTIRCEGAPIPMRARRRWDNGRDTLLVGDAAGTVAPASGEGIYYAMVSGRLGAAAVARFLRTGNPAELRAARRIFMRAHGRVFFILGMMQRFWYGNDARRERFVRICRDPDVQLLTWEAYLNKRLVRARPLAHARIFFKDLAHLAGLARL